MSRKARDEEAGPMHPNVGFPASRRAGGPSVPWHA